MFPKYNMDQVFTTMHTKKPLEEGHLCADTVGRNSDHIKTTLH